MCVHIVFHAIPRFARNIAYLSSSVSFFRASNIGRREASCLVMKSSHESKKNLLSFCSEVPEFVVFFLPLHFLVGSGGSFVTRIDAHCTEKIRFQWIICAVRKIKCLSLYENHCSKHKRRRRRNKKFDENTEILNEFTEKYTNYWCWLSRGIIWASSCLSFVVQVVCASNAWA